MFHVHIFVNIDNSIVHVFFLRLFSSLSYRSMYPSRCSMTVTRTNEKAPLENEGNNNWIFQCIKTIYIYRTYIKILFYDTNVHILIMFDMMTKRRWFIERSIPMKRSNNNYIIIRHIINIILSVLLLLFIIITRISVYIYFMNN